MSVLVAAHSELEVPVGCVEQALDQRRHKEAFTPARQAPDAELAGSTTSACASGSLRPRAARRAGRGLAGDRRHVARHGARSDTGAFMTSSSMAAT